MAHEMGHNLGMQHDFHANHGGSGGPCDGTGIMSYGSAPNVWSTCSKADFEARYNFIINHQSHSWCLDGTYLNTISVFADSLSMCVHFSTGINLAS